MKKTLYVFDCDGVLLDSTHRYRTVINHEGKEVIDLFHWRKYQFAAWFDTPLPTAATYQEAMQNPDNYVIIATAREMHFADYESIAQRIGAPHAYISRPHGSTEGGASLKVKGIKKLLNLKQFKGIDKMHVFEDNIQYLAGICNAFKDMAQGHYVPSLQGH
jgi:phosphoglycolate phosphatase-like HAD superfamily hydrolase